jgi:hypothetical protein
MKRFITLTASMAVLAAFLGCSRIATGGYTDSPDGKYRCWMREFGPLSYSLIDHYTDRIQVAEVLANTKTNYVEKILFTKKYRFKHSVEIDASWDKENNLKVIFYDYGPGVSRTDALKAGSPSNLLATVSLVLDKNKGEYHEQK